MNTLRRTTITLGTLVLTTLVTACGHLDECERNAVVGATLGGVAGSALTGGSTAGTVGGAVAGGVVGNKAGKSC